jgi:thiamine kinase-like enzyme
MLSNFISRSDICENEFGLDRIIFSDKRKGFLEQYDVDENSRIYISGRDREIDKERDRDSYRQIRTNLEDFLISYSSSNNNNSKEFSEIIQKNKLYSVNNSKLESNIKENYLNNILGDILLEEELNFSSKIKFNNCSINSIEKKIKIREFNNENIISFISDKVSEGYTQILKKPNREIDEDSIFMPNEFGIPQHEHKTEEDEGLSSTPIRFVPQLSGLMLEAVPLNVKYTGVLAQVQSEHPGARYVGVAALRHQNLHDIDILGFEVKTATGTEMVYKVMKESSEHEFAVNAFLSNLGLGTCTFTNVGGVMVMNHIDGRTMQSVLRSGSESDVVKAGHNVMHEIGKIQAVATLNLPLLAEMSFMLRADNYIRQTYEDFVLPLSRTDSLVTLEADNFMKAYARFSRLLDTGSFAHRDLHSRNALILNDSATVIDWETAGISGSLNDVATFVNSCGKYRQSLERDEFANEMLDYFVDARNGYSKTLLMPGQHLNKKLGYFMINDHIRRIGVSVWLAQRDSVVRDQKIDGALYHLESAVDMIDGQIAQSQLTTGRESEVLYSLRDSIVKYVASCPIKELSEAAKAYSGVRAYKGSAVMNLKAA